MTLAGWFELFASTCAVMPTCYRCSISGKCLNCTCVKARTFWPTACPKKKGTAPTLHMVPVPPPFFSPPSPFSCIGRYLQLWGQKWCVLQKIYIYVCIIHDSAFKAPDHTYWKLQCRLTALFSGQTCTCISYESLRKVYIYINYHTVYLASGIPMSQHRTKQHQLTKKNIGMSIDISYCTHTLKSSKVCVHTLKSSKSYGDRICMLLP